MEEVTIHHFHSTVKEKTFRDAARGFFMAKPITDNYLLVMANTDKMTVIFLNFVFLFVFFCFVF